MSINALSIDDKATTGDKIEVRTVASTPGKDPMWYRANEVLKQIDLLRADRQKMLREADALYQRIQSLESEFRKMVLELKPSVVEQPTKRVATPSGPSLGKLAEMLRKKLSDDPAFEEKFSKLMEE